MTGVNDFYKVRLNELDRYLLVILFKARDDLLIFTLYKRSRVGFSMFMFSYKKLQKNGFLDHNEGSVKLTNSARQFILLNRSLFIRKKQEFRAIPERFLSTKSSSQFYVPSLKELDKRTFKSLFFKK